MDKIITPMIEAKGVTKIYPTKEGEMRALHDVSFTVANHERVGIAGGSGSGKSTLLKILSMQEEMTIGELAIRGESITSWQKKPRELYRHLQVMFQNSYDIISPQMRLGEFLEEPFRNFNLAAPKEAQDIIATWLAKVGLDPSMLTKYRSECSGGQLQRLALARTMSVEPEIILFDEPTSALDATNQKSVVDTILDVYDKKPFTYVFVSHDLGVLSALTDRIIIMEGGRIVEILPTKELAKAEHPYTKQLLRASR